MYEIRPSLSVLNDTLCDGFDDGPLEGTQWAEQSLGGVATASELANAPGQLLKAASSNSTWGRRCCFVLRSQNSVPQSQNSVPQSQQSVPQSQKLVLRSQQSVLRRNKYCVFCCVATQNRWFCLFWRSEATKPGQNVASLQSTAKTKYCKDKVRQRQHGQQMQQFHQLPSLYINVYP